MDYNATTPLHPEVAAGLGRFNQEFANASSMHQAGRRAKSLIEGARGELASLAGIAAPEEIVFTSGGSESNNTVFQTMRQLHRANPARDKILVSAIEHPCVMSAAAVLAKEGMRVSYLPVDAEGRVRQEDYERELDESCLLVSVMAANNEIGTIQDIAPLAALAHAKGAFFHCDAVQALGKSPVDMTAWDVDYASFSAHKIYGPKGVGALYFKKGVPLFPLINGGHQEGGYRAGTYNTQGILGFGLAARLAKEEWPRRAERLAGLRRRLKDGILSRIEAVRVNGHPEAVLSNTLNCSFPGAEGEAILLSLDLEGIYVSTGSACASGSLEPSHVLVATGVGAELAHGSIRFSMGLHSSEADVDRVLEVLPPAIERLRKMTTIDWAHSDLGRQ